MELRSHGDERKDCLAIEEAEAAVQRTFLVTMVRIYSESAMVKYRRAAELAAEAAQLKAEADLLLARADFVVTEGDDDTLW